MPTDAELRELGKRMAREEMARFPAMSPQGAAETVQDVAATMPGMMNPQSPVMQAVAPAALPTLGNVGGFAAGAALTGGNPLGGMAGESLGGMLGEGANQLLGVTEPSALQLGLAGAIPPAVRGLATTTKAIGRLGPKHGPAALNEVAYQDVSRFVQDRVIPKEAVTAKFKQAEESGIIIPMSNTVRAIDQMTAQVKSIAPEGKSIRENYQPLLDYLESMREKILPTGPATGTPQRVPFGALDEKTRAAMDRARDEAKGIIRYHEGSLTPTELERYLEEVGAVIGGMKEGRELGIAKYLFKGLDTDLEEAADLAKGTQQTLLAKAAGGMAPQIAKQAEGASLLLEARRMHYTRKLIDDMDEVVKDRFILKRQASERQLNANQVLNTIQDSKWYKKAFDQPERAEFNQLRRDLLQFEELTKKANVMAPPIPAGAGVDRGSHNIILNKMLPMMLGGAGGAASMPGNPALGSVVGAAAALTLPVYTQVVKNAALAWTMPSGRLLVRDLFLHSGGRVTGEIASILSAFLAAQAAQPGPMLQPQGASQ